MAIKDYAHKQTDKELEELEKRIAQVYEDAADEMKATVDEYFDNYSKRYEEYKKELDAGNITKEEFQQWELNQIGRGERYEAMRDALAERFVNADEVAMAYVNDATPSIYSLNRNYSNYAINQYDPELDFSLWDESTVRNLIVNQPDLMPYYPKAKAVKRGIDLDYGKSQITKAVTSGILQGKSLTRIANDLMNRIEGMSRASALRSARTAITAAENAGRQDSFDEAADMGLKMEKVWLSTLDSRTRVAHQKADMQVVKYDKTFDVGGEALMFPGDNTHGASGWNLYNCRCTVFEKPEGMSMDDFERWARDPETGAKEQVTGQSYEDWIKSKQGEEAIEDKDYSDKKVTSVADCSNYKELKDYFSNNYGINITDDVLKLDYQYVHEALAGADSILTEYPELANQITEVNTKGAGIMSCDGDTISINPNYAANNGERVREDCVRCSENGWWPKNTSVSSIGAHECGHAVEQLLIDHNENYQYKYEKVLAWNNGTESKNILSQAVKNVKKTDYGKGKVKATLINNISEYATKNSSETLAESYADIYANGSDANPLSIEMKRLIDEKLGKTEAKK